MTIILCISCFKIKEVYVINLERRPERLATVSHQLDKLKLSFTRYNAVDGEKFKTLGIPEFNSCFKLHPETAADLNKCREYCQKNNSWGMFGCWQSHLQVYFKIRNSGKDREDGPFLILEDDVHLDMDLLAALERLVSKLPPDWDIFYLGSSALLGGKFIDDELYHPEQCYSMHAYLIRNSHVAEKLIEEANIETPQTSDSILSMASQQGRIKLFVTYPREYAVQLRGKFPTDILTSEAYTEKKLQNPIPLSDC